MRRETLACMGHAALDDPSDRALVGTTRSSALRFVEPADEHAAVRATAQRVIEALRGPEGVEAAGVEAVARSAAGPERDPSPWVRSAAVSALGALGGPDAVRALGLALLGDPAQDVRLAAARELGELEDASGATTEALLEALRDEALGVRQNARRALRAIHAADLGVDPETWRAWLAARGWQPGAVEPPTPTPGRDAPWGGGDEERVGAPDEERVGGPDEERVGGPDEERVGAPDEERAPAPDEDGRPR